MNILILIFFISSFICASTPSSKDYFYLFDVGQGSCYLVKYHTPQGVVGVLYDAGSSSGVTHPKFIENETDTLIGENFSKPPAGISPPRAANRYLSPPRKHTESKETLLVGQRESPEGTRMSSVLDKAPSTLRDAKDFIKGKIEGIKHLFVFLSHPDSDHISFLPDIIPDTVAVTVFLCGDWLGEGGANTKNDDLSVPVKKVLNFLKEKRLSFTSFCLPHYWGYIYDQQNYQSLKENVKNTQDTRGLFDQFRLKFGSYRYVPSEMFQGNLKEFLEKACKCGDITPTSRDSFLRLFPEVLSNVYIWAANQDFEDPNDQSAIVSCTVPDINMSFIFTGDARDLVFRKAQQRLQSIGTFNQSRYLFKETNHLVWLSLPHHGSEDNISPHAYNFFRPNGFLIPVGSTSSFGHPSYRLMREIREFYNRDPNAKECQKSFYQRFKFANSDVVESCKFVAIEKNIPVSSQGKVEYVARQMNMFGHAGSSVPILCPNIRGHISMSTMLDLLVIQSQGFNPIKEYDDQGKKHRIIVDYDVHISNTPTQKTRNNVIRDQIEYRRLESQPQLYTCAGSNTDIPYMWEIEHKGQSYFYSAREIQLED